MPRIALPHGQSIAYEIAGSGPPVLMLHGFPQCRSMWDRIVPGLRGAFRCITADLRGYGDSPLSDTARSRGAQAMTFRLMARDMAHLLDHLQIERAHIVGHDRGARVAHRFALDHPGRTASLSLLDIVPTEHILTHLSHEVARAYYHWFFLTQPPGLPEAMIAVDPDRFFESCLGALGRGGGAGGF